MNKHIIRSSDASTFDEICVNCGAHDETPGGWGDLAYECPYPGDPYKSLDDYYTQKVEDKYNV